MSDNPIMKKKFYLFEKQFRRMEIKLRGFLFISQLNAKNAKGK